MAYTLEATISGFNENLATLIKEDQEQDDDTVKNVVSLVTFSTQVDDSPEMWCKPVEQIPKLNSENYCPNGMTALNDAIGCSVLKLQEEIKDELKAEDANVVVTVFTDGQNNNSQEFGDYNKVKDLIDKLTGTRMWTFAFVGCNEAALESARNMGFAASNVMAYDGTAAGTSDSMSKMAVSRNMLSKTVRASNVLKGTAAYGEAMASVQQDFFAGDDVVVGDSPDADQPKDAYSDKS